jgi:hypothetical protein
MRIVTPALAFAIIAIAGIAATIKLREAVT